MNTIRRLRRSQRGPLVEMEPFIPDVFNIDDRPIEPYPQHQYDGDISSDEGNTSDEAEAPASVAAEPPVCGSSKDSHSLPPRGFKERLENINYNGWYSVLTQIRMDLVDLDSVILLPYLGSFLTDRECRFIEEKNINERMLHLINILKERPDNAYQFYEVLSQRNYPDLVKAFEDSVNGLPEEKLRRYTKQHPLHEDIHRDAYENALTTHIDRIKALERWATDLLFKNEVITERELNNIINREKCSEKEEMLFSLLKKRDQQQRKRFLSFLLDCELIELHESLMERFDDRPSYSLPSDPSNIPSTPYFVKRRRYIRLLLSKLSEWKKERSPNPPWTLMTGESGVGKSSIAAHVATKAFNYGFTKIIWVTHGRKDIQSVLNEILAQITDRKLDGDPKLLMQQCLNVAHDKNERYLLILDDLTDKELAKQLKMFKFVIVVSMFQTILHDSHRVDPPITVRKFNLKLCKALLRKIIDKDVFERAKQHILSDCLEIIKQCGFSPAATKQIGIVMNEEERWKGDKKKDFIKYLKTEYTDYDKEELCWLQSKGHPAFKIAFNRLREEGKSQLRTLAAFGRGVITPSVMATLWKFDTENKAYDILKSFHEMSLIQKFTHGKGQMHGFSLSEVQLYSLRQETSKQRDDIIKSIVDIYRFRLLKGRESLKHDSFYFVNFVQFCLFVHEYDLAQQTMSDFDYVWQRLQMGAGQNILKDFYETHKRSVKVKKTFKELWNLTDLVISQILLSNSPQLLTRIALFQHSKCALHSSVRKAIRDENPPVNLWRYDTEPRTFSKSWMPKLFKRKLDVQGEGFTKKSFASSIDISPHGRWIVIGCNNGAFYVISSSNFKDEFADMIGSYIFFVHFLEESESQFVLVSNNVMIIYNILSAANPIEVNEERREGISICNFAPYTENMIVGLDEPLLRPVAVSKDNLWLVSYDHIRCYTQFRDKFSSDPPMCDLPKLRDENFYRYIAVKEKGGDYAAITFEDSFMILKLRNNEITHSEPQEVNNCKIVGFTDDRFIYSTENQLKICSLNCSSIKVYVLSTIEIKNEPDSFLSLPEPSNTAIVRTMTELLFLNASKMSTSDIPLNKPLILAAKRENSDISSIYSCHEDGWILKTIIYDNLQNNKVQCSVPQNTLEVNRYNSKPQRLLQLFSENFLSRNFNKSVERTLLITWIEEKDDFLGIILQTKGESNYILKCLLLRKSKVIASCIRPKTDFGQDLQNLSCWYKSERVLIYGDSFILQCFPFRRSNCFVELEWTGQNQYTALCAYGDNDSLAAVTENGTFLKYEESKWINADERLEEGRTPIALVGLNRTNQALALFKTNEDHSVMLFDFEMMSPLGTTSKMSKVPEFQISFDEENLAVADVERAMVKVYKLPDMTIVNGQEVMDIRSFKFSPKDESKLYIVHFNKKMTLGLTIWDFKSNRVCNSIDIFDWYDSTSIFDNPSDQGPTDIVFSSKHSPFFIMTEKCLIMVVDPDTNLSNRHSEIAFDLTWTDEITASTQLQKCITSENGEYLCLQKSDNDAFIIRDFVFN